MAGEDSEMAHSQLAGVERLQEVSASPTIVRAPTERWLNSRTVLDTIDQAIFAFARRAFPWVARSALFVVFFWFGFIKLIGDSEATGLAKALTAKTVGLAHFRVLFNTLAILECVIGVLCLIPRAVRVLIALVFLHMAVVCAPLVL